MRKNKKVVPNAKLQARRVTKMALPFAEKDTERIISGALEAIFSVPPQKQSKEK